MHVRHVAAPGRWLVRARVRGKSPVTIVTGPETSLATPAKAVERASVLLVQAKARFVAPSAKGLDGRNAKLATDWVWRMVSFRRLPVVSE